MADIAALVDALGGLAQKRQLVVRGARDADLTRAVKTGAVMRARQGWYTTLPGDDPRVRAVRVGGRLTGISAVIQAGGWVLEEHPLHVSVPDNAARLRSQRNRRIRFDPSKPNGMRLHWDARELADRGTAWSVGLLDALYRVVLDESAETAIAALDWALASASIDLIDFERLLLRLPEDYRTLRDWVDENCESLPESLTRTRVRRGGHKVRSQVPVGDSGESIDLVVDDCVAIEVDGDKYHRNRFERDRLKDLAITLVGLHGLRPSARTVFSRWELVERAIEAALSSHVSAPARGNSGQLPARVVRLPGDRRNSRRRRRQCPEFPKGQGGGGFRRGRDGRAAGRGDRRE